MTEFVKYLTKCNEVYHTTLDPETPGVCRIHLVPPDKPKPGLPWVVIINGYSVIPLQSSWAVLLKIFMDNLNAHGSGPLSDKEIDIMIDNTIKEIKKLEFIGSTVDSSDIRKDLAEIVNTLKDIALGNEPSSKIGYLTLAKYSKYMSAPHRMDLMLSSMEKNGCWNCNQKCLHCYAANEVMSSRNELSTLEWKSVIDKCRKAKIPALTFTGGEATMRKDLVELVDYAHWFVTRLNTNGILLTKELCAELKKASLDSVQVTLYSYDKNIHNLLVGGDHFDQTIRGIINAIEAGLDVSVNTPLCSLNKDYVKTVEFLNNIGINYFSSSGLIPTGNAKNDESKVTKLTNEEITSVIKEAFEYARNNNCELSFTSPGWIDEKILKEMKMVVPSCGACLSNMAVAPDGEVIPCQSWLKGDTLGNLLTDDWKKIWKSSKCEEIRKNAVRKTKICLLKEDN